MSNIVHEPSLTSQEGIAQPHTVFQGPPVWAVVGTTGEYSDRGEWMVCVFPTEEGAQAYVERLTAERQKLGPEYPDWEEREAIAEKMSRFDPGYSEDYTGTRWFIRETTLVQTLPDGRASDRATADAEPGTGRLANNESPEHLAESRVGMEQDQL